MKIFDLNQVKRLLYFRTEVVTYQRKTSIYLASKLHGKRSYHILSLYVWLAVFQSTMLLERGQRRILDRQIIILFVNKAKYPPAKVGFERRFNFFIPIFLRRKKR